jgi:hypothetical protein
MSPVRMGPENNCDGEDQQLYTTDPSFRKRGLLRTNPQLYDSKRNLLMDPRHQDILAY